MTLTAATEPTAPQPSEADGTLSAETVLAIGDVRWRQRVQVKGKVRALRAAVGGRRRRLECTIVDDTGGLVIIHGSPPHRRWRPAPSWRSRAWSSRTAAAWPS
jgi:hypothetical protein